MKSIFTACMSASLFAVAPFPALAQEATARQATELFPATAVLYVCLPAPADTVDLLLDHPITARILEMEGTQKALAAKNMQQLREVVRFVEADVNMKWRETLRMATSGGVHVCVDAKTQGLAILIKTTDEQQRHKILARLIQLARDDAKSKGKDDPYETHDYRGITAYKIDKGGFAELGPWLLISNKPDLAKSIADAHLDGATENLAAADWFTDSQQQANTNSTAWAVLDLDTLRKAGVAPNLFANRTENIVAEVLLGGIQSTLYQSDHVAASLNLAKDRAELKIATPFAADWIGEAREHYFGAVTDSAPPPLKTAAAFLSVSLFRDLSRAWTYASDTLVEKGADELATAESGLSNLFGGRDFGEDVLGAFRPGIRLIVARQDFSNKPAPLPAIRLPAFAIIADLKDETMVPELRRMFQSLIGFFNIVGAMNGQPQLEMDMEKDAGVQYITSRFLPTEDNRDAHDAAINYNFSPSVAFAGDRFVLASCTDLVRELSTAKPSDQQPYSSTTNTLIQADFDVARQTLEDNREHLISQNMLEKGHSREEAEGEINTLLDLMTMVDSGTIQLNRMPHRLELGVTIGLSEK